MIVNGMQGHAGYHWIGQSLLYPTVHHMPQQSGHDHPQAAQNARGGDIKKAFILMPPPGSPPPEIGSKCTVAPRTDFRIRSRDA